MEKRQIVFRLFVPAHEQTTKAVHSEWLRSTTQRRALKPACLLQEKLDYWTAKNPQKACVIEAESGTSFTYAEYQAAVREVTIHARDSILYASACWLYPLRPEFRDDGTYHIDDH